MKRTRDCCGRGCVHGVQTPLELASTIDDNRRGLVPLVCRSLWCGTTYGCSTSRISAASSTCNRAGGASVYRGTRKSEQCVICYVSESSLGARFSVDVAGPDDLEARGDFLDHEYVFDRAGREVARVSKRWFSIADTYAVDVDADQDDVLILACALVIDLVSHPDDQER